jgi:hypothetical protein
MAKEMQPIDITHTPDVLRLAEEVARSGIPRVLRKGGQDVAELRPVSPPRARRRGRPTSEHDPLWRIVGIADADAPDDLPTDISSNVDSHLADAYADPHT